MKSKASDNKRIAAGQDILEKLSITRTRIEAAARGPAVVTVTSAQATDGTNLLAYGLAQSLAAVGRGVLLVRSEVTPSAPEGRTRSIRAAKSGEPSILDLSDAYSFDAAQAAFAEFRNRYAFTIVDAAVALRNGSALSLVGAADFVLVAVEHGRPSRDADRELASALRSAHANTLGVVTIGRKAIRRFANDAQETKLPVRPSRVDIDLLFDPFEEAVGRGSPLASRLG
jgi:hypothetical protein